MELAPSSFAQIDEHVTAAETETPPGTDYGLAQKAAQGDMDAFEQLYQRHNRRVYSLCLRMTGNVSEAEDLAQEVFIQLFRKIGSFRGESAFTTWLHRLTVNQVLMHFRKRGVKMEQTTEDGETPVQIVKGTENPNAMPVVDRIALEKPSCNCLPVIVRFLRFTISKGMNTKKLPGCWAALWGHQNHNCIKPE